MRKYFSTNERGIKILVRASESLTQGIELLKRYMNHSAIAEIEVHDASPGIRRNNRRNREWRS